MIQRRLWSCKFHIPSFKCSGYSLEYLEMLLGAAPSNTFDVSIFL